MRTGAGARSVTDLAARRTGDRGRFAAAVLTVVLCVSAGTAPAIGGPSAAAAEDGSPLFFWTATGHEATVYLLGSVHVGSADFYPLDPAIEEAFAASGVLAVELDMADPAIAADAATKIMQAAMLPADETLRDRVSAETWQALRDYLVARELAPATYERLRASAVAMLLTVSELQRDGFDPRLGVDLHFLERARETGRRIVSLETVDEQVAALFADDAETEELLLRESLAQSDSLQTMLEGMLEAWRAGDTEAIAALIEEQLLDDPRLVAFHDRILIQRNRRMADRLLEQLQPGETWFVVVGAAHLVGEGSLLQLLGERGFAIEQVRSEAAVPAR
jgi:uncharacterized protein YbaP (TraB family)